MADKSLGKEDQLTALQAIEEVLKKYPLLKQLVENTSIPHRKGKRGDIWPCPSQGCFGSLHAAGRNKLPDGRLCLSTFFVCDACGHYESRLK